MREGGRVLLSSLNEKKKVTMSSFHRRRENQRGGPVSSPISRRRRKREENEWDAVFEGGRMVAVCSSHRSQKERGKEKQLLLRS